MKRVLFAVALAVAIAVPSVAASAELSGKSGRWEYRLKVTHPGTKSEGAWGTLSYDGKKVPDGTTVNDFYRTPWGKIYWVGMPASEWGRHGWMLEPVRGRELTPPVAKKLRAERVAPAKKKAELVDLLLNPNAIVRHRAGSALRKLGPADEDDERRFLNLAKHSNAVRRELGVEALGRLNSQSLQVITALTAAMQDTDADVRLAGALALGRTLKSWQAEPSRRLLAALPALVRALKDSDPRVRYRAATVLGERGPAARSATPALIELLKTEKVSPPRWSAAFALGKFGLAAKDAVPALIEALADRHESVRTQAAYALGKIGCDAGLAALIKTLDDPHSDVRATAAEAVGMFGPRASAAVPALLRLSDDKVERVREAAAKALRRIQRA